MDKRRSVENRIKGVCTFGVPIINSKKKKNQARGGEIRRHEAGEPVVGHHDCGDEFHAAECLEGCLGHQHDDLQLVLRAACGVDVWEVVNVVQEQLLLR